MDTVQVVQIKCTAAGILDISQMTVFQGELKSLSKEDYGKLRGEILTTGYAFPIHIWKEGEINYIVGGTQRHFTLTQIRAEGIEVPSVPVVYVEADSYEQAKHRVLQDVTQYGKVERQGLYQFMVENEIDPGQIAKRYKIPDLDMPSFNEEFFMDSVVGSQDDDPGKTGSKELDENDFKNFEHKCPRCGFEFD